MGQPTQRATNYTARSNIDTAQIFLHTNGQRPKRAQIRQRSWRRQRRGEPHTEHTGIPCLFEVKQYLVKANGAGITHCDHVVAEGRRGANREGWVRVNTRDRSECMCMYVCMHGLGVNQIQYG